MILYEGHGVQKRLSENPGDVQYDQHLATASSTWFHADQINLRIGMVQVTARKSPKIPRCWLDGSRDLMSKRIVKCGLNRGRCHWMRMAENDVFLIFLWSNILLNMWHVDEVNYYILQHWAVLGHEYRGHVLH